MGIVRNRQWNSKYLSDVIVIGAIARSASCPMVEHEETKIENNKQTFRFLWLRVTSNHRRNRSVTIN